MSPRCVISKKLMIQLNGFFFEFFFGRAWVSYNFVNWVMACVGGVSYTIMLNGIPSPPFQAKNGLRQGDALSPFLFSLCME